MQAPSGVGQFEASAIQNKLMTDVLILSRSPHHRFFQICITINSDCTQLLYLLAEVAASYSIRSAGGTGCAVWLL